MNLSRDFGMKDGISFPVHGPGNDYGVLSFTSAKKQSIPNTIIVAATNLYVQKLHCCLKDVFDSVPKPDIKKLSPREIDVLYWVSEGKTAWEIGEILNISQRTVEDYINSSKGKLGSITVAQAIAKAMTIRFREPL